MSRVDALGRRATAERAGSPDVPGLGHVPGMSMPLADGDAGSFAPSVRPRAKGAEAEASPRDADRLPSPECGILSAPAARWATLSAARRRRLKILVLGMNYAPEPVGVALYTTGLAEGLAARGHSVAVVSATPWYPAWAPMEGHPRGWTARTENGVQVIRCPHPVPRRPSAAARIVQQAAWAAMAAGPLAAAARRLHPDIVLAIAPAALAAPAALVAARLAGARTWLHVQDFEAEAALGAGLFRGRTGRWATRGAIAFEARLLASFDRVSSISPMMCTRLEGKGVAHDRVRELRNWAELDAIKPLEAPSPYRALWGLEGRRVALYSGNIGAKQGAEIIVDAARLLAGRHGFEDLRFVICGEGPNLPTLLRRAAGLPNLLFRPLQPFARLGDLLGLADIHLLPQLAGAADLVLPSKLANMLASGRPVAAAAAEGTQIAAEIAGCGLTSPPEDAAAFAEIIAALAAAPRMRAALGRAARARAAARWDRGAVLDGAETAMLGLAAEAEGLSSREVEGLQTADIAARRAETPERVAAAEAAEREADAALAAAESSRAGALARAAVFAEAAGASSPETDRREAAPPCNPAEAGQSDATPCEVSGPLGSPEHLPAPDSSTSPSSRRVARPAAAPAGRQLASKRLP